ncbi:probable S-adenosylmethionine-dependent methyltransferase At5g38780 [Pecten maximus]|uniref:probable S-adenosylmethionine-dependent methyltransferase At5g38780 n=1 Tax=Pecten maximus TaxID=6579 RepID=UPI001458D442|nr:probable S-adenosylmethionine-dependent methyltransferase At5g38780 [Pecten maximus]
MKMKSRFTGGVDDMYNVHGHAGNLCREAILEGLVEPVTIADFGTADGRAALSIINEMIGNTQNPGLTLTGNVYPVMIPRTMYEQCLPDNTIDLAISAAATHYLSKQVCQIKNGVFIDEADDEQQELMREQGKTDWRDFVISRGRELKPGGFLIVLNASSNDSEEMSSTNKKGKLLLGGIVSDMAREGIITQEEYLATNFHVHYLRKAVDFKEPFTGTLPEIGELGLELVSMKSIKYYTPNPTVDIVDKDMVDKLKYSQWIVAMVYPWFYHVIHGGLSDSRTKDEKETIIAQYFSRLQKFAFDNSDFKPYLIFTEIVIKKNMK